MAGCASCGGCCAQCASTCGALVGAPLGALAGMDGSGFSYFTSNHPLQNVDGDAIPVDGEALVAPDHPGHRHAIKTMSHVDDATHENIVQRLRNEVHHIERGGDPQ